MSPCVAPSIETFTRADGTAHVQICVSRSPDHALFEQVPSLLERELGGHWTERLNGIDQRYWDFEADAGAITLHLEHYVGICVFPTEGHLADTASLELLDRAYRALSDGAE